MLKSGFIFNWRTLGQAANWHRECFASLNNLIIQDRKMCTHRSANLCRKLSVEQRCSVIFNLLMMCSVKNRFSDKIDWYGTILCTLLSPSGNSGLLSWIRLQQPLPSPTSICWVLVTLSLTLQFHALYYPFRGIQAAFPGYGYSSRYPVLQVHAGSFDVSIIHWTLTWTAGSLTYVRDHWYAFVYTHGLGTQMSQHNIFHSETCAPGGVRTQQNLGVT